MAKLNITATNSLEQIVLDNLIPMVSDVLADKINNGVYIEKDGKRLLNKKDLTAFMTYATEQARKIYNEQQQKGSQAVCVLGDDIMSWAIHYFEEDSIEGNLFNEDGTEYKPPKTGTKTKPVKVDPPKPKPQLSIFDLLGEPTKSSDTPIATTEHQQNSLSPFYSRYVAVQEQYPDSIVLMRLGDFYEAFDDDATTLANELDLTLTGRYMGFEERLPMVGFPYHASDSYIAKIREKHDVVIIEDGNVMTLSQTVRKNGLTVDTGTGEILNDEIEELSETKMRQFDGDIQEPKTVDEQDDEPASYSLSSFDKETMIYLYDLLDGKFDMA